MRQQGLGPLGMRRVKAAQGPPEPRALIELDPGQKLREQRLTRLGDGVIGGVPCLARRQKLRRIGDPILRQPSGGRREISTHRPHQIASVIALRIGLAVKDPLDPVEAPRRNRDLRHSVGRCNRRILRLEHRRHLPRAEVLRVRPIGDGQRPTACLGRADMVVLHFEPCVKSGVPRGLQVLRGAISHSRLGERLRGAIKCREPRQDLALHHVAHIGDPRPCRQRQKGDPARQTVSHALAAHHRLPK